MMKSNVNDCEQSNKDDPARLLCASMSIPHSGQFTLKFRSDVINVLASVVPGS